MNINPRPYRDEIDLFRARHLLSKGRRAENRTYYPHPGNLGWWMYYSDHPEEELANLYLWDRPGSGGGLAAFTLISPAWHAWDVFIDPDYCQEPDAGEIWRWSMERAAEDLRPTGQREIRTMWVSEEDDFTISVLEAAGCRRTDASMTAMKRFLDEDIRPVDLPDGFRTGGLREELVEARAEASYKAFQSGREWNRYLPRYRRFR